MNARSVLIGAAAGSALMFMLDPNGGRRRRALVRDQLTRARRKTRNELDATARDIANRAGGIVAATRGRWSRDMGDDVRLVERVRAKLGRVCSHPRAIDVIADNGQITLRGPVLTSEADAIVAAAAAVRGVGGVCNAMEVHETAEDIPALQGEGRAAGSSLDILQNRWAPATRAMVGAGLLATGVCVAVCAARMSHDPEYRHAAM
jgi:BON domain